MLSDRYNKSRVAVEDSDADLNFCDFPYEVPRHQRLVGWFHTMHPLTGSRFKTIGSWSYTSWGSNCSYPPIITLDSYSESR